MGGAISWRDLCREQVTWDFRRPCLWGSLPALYPPPPSLGLPPSSQELAFPSGITATRGHAPPRCGVTPCPFSAVGYGSWFEHVQEFWEHRTDSNVLFLKYEDMHRVSAALGASGRAWVVGALPPVVGLTGASESPPA